MHVLAIFNEPASALHCGQFIMAQMRRISLVQEKQLYNLFLNIHMLTGNVHSWLALFVLSFHAKQRFLILYKKNICLDSTCRDFSSYVFLSAGFPLLTDILYVES